MKFFKYFIKPKIKKIQQIQNFIEFDSLTIGITEEQIKQEAYLLWCNAGKPYGNDEYFWFKAIESLNKDNI